MPGGYVGRILHVDLTTGKHWVEAPEDAFYRRLMGGRAMIAHYLLTLVPKGADPLGPENVLVFAAGILTGAPFSGQGRNGVGAKSPLTGGFGNAEAGGYWGAELKRAGFDAIVVRGKSDHPVYLWIKDTEVELREGNAVWGLPVAEAEAQIRFEVGDKGARTALIGPAGENLVRYAAIVNDLSHFAGRTGMGAVMGSKNLKGIAVRATGHLAMVDPGPARELGKWVNEHLDLTMGLTDTGTAGGLYGMSVGGSLPTANFQQGAFAEARNINGDTMRDTILIDRGTCYACLVRCKRIVEVKQPEELQVDPRYGGPEYESMAALGSNCGVGDLKAVARANHLCAAYGLDTISTGVSISWAMECFERGLLTADDVGDESLRFGDARAMLRTIESIAFRWGALGDLLADGVKRASERIGKGTDKYALHVMGLELPLHDPRTKHGVGLGYTLSPTGADHNHNTHENVYMAEGHRFDRIREFGDFPLQTSLHGFDDNKLKLHLYQTAWRHFMDCGIVCGFVPLSPGRLSSVMNAMTGWDTTIWDLLDVGKRAWMMAWLFNRREGINPVDTMLPDRFFGEYGSGGSDSGKPMDPAELDAARVAYFRALGCDEQGVPTKETIDRLDLREYAVVEKA